MINQAFFINGATQNVAVAAAATNTTLNAAHLTATGVRLVNVGTQTVFVELGQNGTVAAATVTTSMPIPAGTSVIVGSSRLTNISSIAAATGSTLYITPVLGN